MRAKDQLVRAIQECFWLISQCVYFGLIQAEKREDTLDECGTLRPSEAAGALTKGLLLHRWRVDGLIRLRFDPKILWDGDSL